MFRTSTILLFLPLVVSIGCAGGIKKATTSPAADLEALKKEKGTGKGDAYSGDFVLTQSEISFECVNGTRKDYFPEMKIDTTCTQKDGEYSCGAGSVGYMHADGTFAVSIQLPIEEKKKLTINASYLMKGKFTGVDTASGKSTVSLFEIKSKKPLCTGTTDFTLARKGEPKQVRLTHRSSEKKTTRLFSNILEEDLGRETIGITATDGGEKTVIRLSGDDVEIAGPLGSFTPRECEIDRDESDETRLSLSFSCSHRTKGELEGWISIPR
jgi:hypothetical protein